MPAAVFCWLQRKEAAVNRPPSMTQPQRRKPVETDPGIVAALRGQRRPEAEQAAPVAQEEEPTAAPAADIAPAPEAAW